MSDDVTPSTNWTAENVLKRLEERTPSGRAASVQIFLADTVSADDLTTVVREIVEAARMAAGAASRDVEIGKIYPLAKSFSVKAAPSVIRQISNLGRVKAILPSKIEEGLLIKPLKSTPVP